MAAYLMGRPLNPEQIAAAAYEVNSAVCETLVEYSDEYLLALLSSVHQIGRARDVLRRHAEWEVSQLRGELTALRRKRAGRRRRVA